MLARGRRQGWTYLLLVGAAVAYWHLRLSDQQRAAVTARWQGAAQQLSSDPAGFLQDFWAQLQASGGATLLLAAAASKLMAMNIRRRRQRREAEAQRKRA